MTGRDQAPGGILPRLGSEIEAAAAEVEIVNGTGGMANSNNNSNDKLAKMKGGGGGGHSKLEQVWQAKTNAETVCTFANPCWAEIMVLVRRSWKNIKRTPELFWMRLATVVVTGFVLATIFWRLDHTPDGVQV